MNEIYQRMILDYAKVSQRETADHLSNTDSIQLDNPSCGDRIKLVVERDGQLVTAISYQVEGCIICRAALAIMKQQLMNQTVPTINHLITAFSQLMMNQPIDTAAKTQLGDAVGLHAIVKLPVRIKCAMLPWKAISQALNGGISNR
ncbi:Fe-S cluster assembly sulfur transfer protein SufU [Nicoliella lavandulae]|uniref:SUF system NifU family Fe-S cluster assembly protein n=1 Tax=Nicoliella lavandulae TaxID=3082954 RepID=A0ABU8SN06_9LACO